jgi:hypothetical protein
VTVILTVMLLCTADVCGYGCGCRCDTLTANCGAWNCGWLGNYNWVAERYLVRYHPPQGELNPDRAMEWVVGDQGTLDQNLPMERESQRDKYYPSRLDLSTSPADAAESPASLSATAEGGGGHEEDSVISVNGHSVKIATTNPPLVPIRDLIGLICDLDPTDKGSISLRSLFYKRGFQPQRKHRFACGQFALPVVEWTPESIDGPGGLLEWCKNVRSGRFAKKVENFRNSHNWTELEQRILETARSSQAQGHSAAEDGSDESNYRSSSSSSSSSSGGGSSSRAASTRNRRSLSRGGGSDGTSSLMSLSSVSTSSTRVSHDLDATTNTSRGRRRDRVVPVPSAATASTASESTTAAAAAVAAAAAAVAAEEEIDGQAAAASSLIAAAESPRSGGSVGGSHAEDGSVATVADDHGKGGGSPSSPRGGQCAGSMSMISGSGSDMIGRKVAKEFVPKGGTNGKASSASGGGSSRWYFGDVINTFMVRTSRAAVLFSYSALVHTSTCAVP